MNRNSDGEYSNFCRQFFNNVPLKAYKFWIITLNDLSCATATPHPALPVPPPLPLSSLWSSVVPRHLQVIM